MEKFTIEEIKNYLKSQDSFGDAVYYLSAENIHKANSLSQTRSSLMQELVDDADNLHATELLEKWENYLDLEWFSPEDEHIHILRFYPEGNPFHTSGGDCIASHELTFKNGQLQSVEEIEE